ncbi:unnamed protein product [Pylaiella littoralis]
MSEFSSQRTHYDDTTDDEDEAVADSGHNLLYRSRRCLAGGVETMRQPQQSALEPAFCGGGGGDFTGKASPSPFDNSSNKLPDEPKVSLWAEASASQSTGPGRPYGQPAPESYTPREHQEGYGQGEGLPVLGYNPGFEAESPPRFWSPFGSVGKTTTEGSSSNDGENSDGPSVITLPSTFRLERTNFVATSPSGSGHSLTVDFLVAALRSSLSEAGVDVLEFKPAHCVLQCSYHVGNRFLGLFVRVFRAPDRASGQLVDTADGDDQFGGDGEEKAPLLVEAQLREGDRLHFSALFREIMLAFKNQKGVHLAGTFRYQPQPYPGRGEGLALEAASLAPSRNSVRLLADRVGTVKAVGDNAAAGVRRALADGSGGGGGTAAATSAAGGGIGLGPSPPPVPPGMAKTQDPSELDVDMMDDVTLLANMLRGRFLDVQADAATAVAGLTTDPQLLGQLSLDGASKAASDLTSASARLLVETRHRPARRQAAVVVANLSTTPKLRAALLASDPPARGGGGGGVSTTMGRASSPVAQQGRLVDSLVALAMGIDGGRGGGGEASAGSKKEEEIGMRRECMRALVGLAECQTVRDTASMKLLLSTEPTGRGAKDATLMKRLLECRTVLKNRL